MDTIKHVAHVESERDSDITFAGAVGRRGRLWCQHSAQPADQKWRCASFLPHGARFLLSFCEGRRVVEACPALLGNVEGTVLSFRDNLQNSLLTPSSRARGEHRRACVRMTSSLLYTAAERQRVFHTITAMCSLSAIPTLAWRRDHGDCCSRSRWARLLAQHDDVRGVPGIEVARSPSLLLLSRARESESRRASAECGETSTLCTSTSNARRRPICSRCCQHAEGVSCVHHRCFAGAAVCAECGRRVSAGGASPLPIKAAESWCACARVCVPFRPPFDEEGQRRREKKRRTKTSPLRALSGGSISGLPAGSPTSAPRPATVPASLETARARPARARPGPGGRERRGRNRFISAAKRRPEFSSRK